MAVGLVGYLSGGVRAAVGGLSGLVVVYLVGYGITGMLLNKASECEANTRREYPDS